MRIISGSFRGRKLVQLTGLDVRPTSDRAREAVFNIIGPAIRDASVLDLFSGTGALGIEALSRGAAHTSFIDRKPHITRANVDLLGLTQNAEIIQQDLLNCDLSFIFAHRQFDVVFIDPPYHQGLIESVINRESFNRILKDNCRIYAEHDVKEILKIENTGLDFLRQKKYSKTIISIYGVKRQG